jgi:hypothetical protein
MKAVDIYFALLLTSINTHTIVKLHELCSDQDCGKDISTENVGKGKVKGKGKGKVRYPCTRSSGIQGCTFIALTISSFKFALDGRLKFKI